MKYIAICIALYDYQSQNDEEISFYADDILYILDKEDPDWYKAQLKVPTEEGVDTTGPVGLIPANYVENAKPIGSVKALYEYASQSAEELSFKEAEQLTLYEKDDPDWFVVENAQGEFGLAPSNYVEEQANIKTPLKTHAPATISIATNSAATESISTETSPPPAAAQNQSNCEPKWAIALFAFQPEGQEETYLQENEQVLITDYVSSQDWWTIEHKNGTAGIVPASYVKFQDEFEHELKKEQELEKKKAEQQALKERQKQEMAKREQQRKDEYQARDRERQRELEERNRLRDQEEKEKARQAEVGRRRKMQEEAKQKELEAKKQASIAAAAANAIGSPQLSGSDSPRRSQIPAPLPPRKSVPETSSYNQYTSAPPHNDPNKPDPSKVRMWTDRTGAFKVEAQFLTCANGKIRLFKTNGVKIDVPTRKMCVEDLHYIQQETGLKLVEDKSDNIPLGQLNNNRFTWLDYFKRANLPHTACIQYARSFDNSGLGEQDVERLTYRQMKSLGMEERHVRRIQRFIETNRAEPHSDNEQRPKLKTKKSVTFGAVSYIEDKDDDDYDYEEGSVEWQINQDEILARQLQEQEQAHSPMHGGLHRRGTGRPTPSHSAPRGVNSAALTPQQFSTEPLKPITATAPPPPPPVVQQPLQPSPAPKTTNLVPTPPPKPTATSFEDDAWAPRAGSSPSIQPKPTTTAISSTPPQMPPRQRPTPPVSQQSLVDPQLLAKWGGSPALAAANTRPVPPPPAPSNANNSINALQAQQQQQQAMFYQQQQQQQQQALSTGNSSFTSLQQQQQALPTVNSSFTSLQQQSQLPTVNSSFTSLQQLPTGNSSFTSLQQSNSNFTPAVQQQPSVFNSSPLIHQNNQQFMGSPALLQNQTLSAPNVVPQQQNPNFNTPQMTGSIASRNWATATPDNPFGGASTASAPSPAPIPIYNSTGGTFQQVQQSFQQQQNTGFIPQQPQQYNTPTMIDPHDKYSVFKTLDTSTPSVFNSNSNQQQQNFYYK